MKNAILICLGVLIFSRAIGQPTDLIPLQLQMDNLTQQIQVLNQRAASQANVTLNAWREEYYPLYPEAISQGDATFKSVWEKANPLKLSDQMPGTPYEYYDIAVREQMAKEISEKREQEAIIQKRIVEAQRQSSMQSRLLVQQPSPKNNKLDELEARISALESTNQQLLIRLEELEQVLQKH